MVTVVGEFTAAQLALGINVFDMAPFSDYATAKFKRKVRKVTLVGGAGVADLVCDLQYGSRKQAIGIHNNQTALEPSEITGVPVCSLDTCYPDEKLMLVVTDAPAASDVMFKVEIV